MYKMSGKKKHSTVDPKVFQLFSALHLDVFHILCDPIKSFLLVDPAESLEYSLEMTNSSLLRHGPFMVDSHLKDGEFPYVSLPKGISD